MSDGRGTRFKRKLAWAWTHSRAAFITVVALIVLLIAVRAMLPSILKRAINSRLDHIPAYTGHVDDVGVQLWHGGYTMHNLVIIKRGGKPSEPFVSASDISFSIAYRQLVHGRFVSDVTVDNGSLNFVRGPTPETSQLEADRRWQDVVKDLFPIDITDLEVKNSRLRYVDDRSSPRVAIAIENLRLSAAGLKNRAGEKGGDPMPARITLEGNAFGRGHLRIFVKAEPLAAAPHFKLSLELEGVSIPDLNDFIMAYANFDVGAGTFDGYMEMSAADGNFEGYVKPLFKDLKFRSATDDKKNLWQQLWKQIVTVTAQILKNKSANQVATLVPFSGTFKQQTSVEFWRTIGNLLKNGFVQAFHGGLEGSPAAKKEKPLTNAAPQGEPRHPGAGAAKP